MRNFVIIFLALLPFTADSQVKQSDVTRILNTLASDTMMGRKAGTPQADKASAFIANEFRKAGLKTFTGAMDYFQSFNMLGSETLDASVNVDSLVADPADILVFAEKETIDWNNSGAEKIWIPGGVNFGQKLFGMTREKGDRIIFADSSYRKTLKRFRSFPMQRFVGSGNIVVVLTSAEPKSYKVLVKSRINSSVFRNVIAMIPGKKTEEFVVFSGHYDHLGAGKPVEGDSIFNGANDDASGTTAVISLAKFFKKMKQPERTLLFVAFTAEESGGYGSTYFSQQLDPAQVMAMFNIEMIGTDSKWGKNSAYITGYERSDFGAILQENLKGSAFTFYPDPYPDQNLFFRSDNATLARLGVPAHTISTSKMDSEKYYHTVDDEVETLDMQNMTEIIKAIAASSKGIISGKQTPGRVKGL
jgi:Peptidase family M28